MSERWGDVWRQTRSAEVAALIEALPSPAAKLYPSSATVEQKQREWLAAAVRQPPDQLPALLATLRDADPTALSARLDAVARWPADPRTASTLVRLYEQPAHVGVRTVPLWTKLGGLLVHLADPRVAPRLDALAALGDGWSVLFRVPMRPLIVQHLASLRAALAERLALAKARALTPDERAEIARTMPRAPASPLLDAIYASPDDLELRAVYGDALLAQGDPRGELIALQRAADPTAEQEGRIAALLAEHGRSWLGVLDPVVDLKTAEFELGFPAALTLKHGALRELSQVLGDRAWATVHTLRFKPRKSGQHPLELLVHPAMRHLRTIEGLHSGDLGGLVHLGRPLPVQRLIMREEISHRALDFLESVTVFPRLAELEMVSTWYSEAFFLAWAREGGRRLKLTLRVEPR